MRKPLEDSDALELLLHIQEDVAEIESQLREAVAQLPVDGSAAMIIVADCGPPDRLEDGLDTRFLALLALAGFTVSSLY